MIDCNDPLRRYVLSADPEAFRELLIAYRPMVMGVCRRVLGDQAAAEDAAQETFLQLSRHACTIRSNVGSWLYTCALNEARRLRRSEEARRRNENAWASEEPAPWLDALDSEECDLLNRCIADLPDQERDVITLHFFLGLSQERIAGRYRISQPAVGKRLDRALRVLRYEIVRRGLVPADLFSRHADAFSGPLRTRMLSLGLAVCGCDLALSEGIGQSVQLRRPTLPGMEWALASAPAICALIMSSPDNLRRRGGDPHYRPSTRPDLAQCLLDALLDTARALRNAGDLCARLLLGMLPRAQR